MKKIIIILLFAGLLVNCGSDSTTNPEPTEVSVTVSPNRIIMDLGADQQFSATVTGTNNRAVTWRVMDLIGGNSTTGTITASGLFTSPSVEPDLDSIKITAVLIEDVSKLGTAWVHLTDPTKIYVDDSGSDTTGTGSRNNPYRTITHALNVVSGQSILVGSGTYNMTSGETFPLNIGTGISISGAGYDSTHVIGPGGAQDESGAVFLANGSVITIEDFNISTLNGTGVGIHLTPGPFSVRIRDNRISSNVIGINITNPNQARPIIETNIISGDTTGIVTEGECEPILRDNQITDCGIYGLYIKDTSRPDLGRNDSTDAGGNTFNNCGTNNHYLIYNESPDTIFAIGNTWIFITPSANDQFIYDDEESNDVSGPVILE